MTAIWMGHDTVASALKSLRLKLTGHAHLALDMQSWLGLSPFAMVKQAVAS